MKSASQWLHRVGVLAVCLIVTACSNAPQKDDSAASGAVSGENFYVGKSDVYAYLETGSGGSWIFTQLTESDMPPASGYLVRLNDLVPAFDTRIAECTTQNYPTDHKCSPLHPFRNKDVGVIGKMISGGISAGTGGKVTDVSRTYETSFDETAFNQAVDEALTNTGLDSQRRDLFAVLERYAESLADGRSTLSALRNEMNAKYRDTSTVQLEIQPNITGLTAYYSNDIDLRSLIELVPRASQTTASQFIEEKSLLPCDARRCLQDAREAYASLSADVGNARAQLTEASARGQRMYDVRCDKTTQAGYLFTLSCPPEVAHTNADPVRLPISVHILARDFESLYPSMDIADDKLSITIAGADVTFKNRTPSYLTVTAQTVYYNSQVQTTASKMSIAPGAAVNRKISEFASPAIDIESSFRQMTPDKAENTSFRFGFAANYRVAGEAGDTTLHELRVFNVGCAIANRVKPDSCDEAPPEDVATSVPF